MRDAISVVIPTYQRPDLLARLLESICNQTRLPEEVIVVDDASGMDAEYRECIGRFSLKLKNLQYIGLARNAGAPHARNVGIAASKGDWIALVDDDDEWIDRKLELQVAKVREVSDRVGLIYTWVDALAKDGRLSYRSRASVSGDARTAILNTNFIMSASVMVRRDAIMSIGGFDEALPSCQDWDAWARLFLAGYNCDVVPQVLAIYHQHGGESIGLSSKAKLGYKKFLIKHWKSIFRYSGPVNWVRKIFLYVKVYADVWR